MHFPDAELCKQIRLIADNYGVESLRIFGSAVRNELTEHSDIDFLVAFKSEAQGWNNYIGLVHELEAILKRPVDVVTEQSISPHMLPYIMQEARDI